MTEIKLILGRIRSKRIEKKLSQREVAIFCGWHKNRWQRYESGSSDVSLSELFAMIHALKARPREIFIGK